MKVFRPKVKTIQKFQQSFNVCEEADKYLEQCKSLEEAWDNCPKAEWLIWALGQLDPSFNTNEQLLQFLLHEVELLVRKNWFGEVREAGSKILKTLRKKLSDPSSDPQNLTAWVYTLEQYPCLPDNFITTAIRRVASLIDGLNRHAYEASRDVSFYKAIVSMGYWTRSTERKDPIYLRDQARQARKFKAIFPNPWRSKEKNKVKKEES